MISVNEKLIVTKQVNEIMCRYAKQVLLKDFLYHFSFTSFSKRFNKLSIENVNPLLETLNYHQGDFNLDTLPEVINYLNYFLNHLDEHDIMALYFLSLNQNYFQYNDNFIKQESLENIDSFELKLGREFAYKLYEPEASGLREDVEKMLMKKISRLVNELDLSLVTEESIEEIIESIETISS
ncbi:hypothetical protein SY27_05225 [Flavobacterium sp. 316]|uniref:hypothetical protein n=1 Tax=Flavobacterium sp. 316 TaxID=1603293 RepID=UPI0005E8B9C3|nr:hypothetical protein [Flavobacterium sp. 316]KIX22070.1 hypothetical protein SY27_05225 [Flavobacterium sp. 316]